MGSRLTDYLNIDLEKLYFFFLKYDCLVGKGVHPADVIEQLKKEDSFDQKFLDYFAIVGLSEFTLQVNKSLPEFLKSLSEFMNKLN